MNWVSLGSATSCPPWQITKVSRIVESKVNDSVCPQKPLLKQNGNTSVQAQHLEQGGWRGRYLIEREAIFVVYESIRDKRGDG